MKPRSIAPMLVIVMLLASGRLLACGWECSDELAAPEVASCHEDSESDREGLPTVALAMVGEAAHACLPEAAEPRVTATKPWGAQALVAAPAFARVVPAAPPTASAPHRRSAHAALQPPRPPALSILRI